jgi:hypothetical protein
MSTPDESALQARINELEARNHELSEKLRLYAPSTERLPGSRVVPIFIVLIALSVGLAVVLWNSGKKTAKERAAQRPTAPTAARIDQAGWAVVQGLHGCLSEARMDDDVDIRIEARLTPAGTLGLTDAVIKPINDRFVPCVRRVPSGVKLEAETGNGAPQIEIRYLIERPQEGNYQARWSWRLLAP